MAHVPRLVAVVPKRGLYNVRNLSPIKLSPILFARALLLSLVRLVILLLVALGVLVLGPLVPKHVVAAVKLVP